jgi:hypothetical protein
VRLTDLPTVSTHSTDAAVADIDEAETYSAR